MDWPRITLFLYVAMRMTGFVSFNPLTSRRNIPGMVRAGFILVLSVTVFLLSGDSATVPATTLELIVRMLLELCVGFALGFIMQLFFYIPTLAGNVIDTQMGLSMASTYDAGSQINASVTTTLLSTLMALLFFAAGGHLTLMRILLTSGDIVPFGTAALGTDAANAVIECFIDCTLLAIKLSLPILGAELITQVGMGILMKAIPQINAFVINIELKVVVGLLLVWMLMSPFSEFLLTLESDMLALLRHALTLMTA